MTKKAYMKPATNVVKIQQQRVICASLQSEEVDNAWSRKHKDVWDEDQDEEE